MEVTINGEHRQLVGNPPAVGEDVPHFKVFDKDNQKIKTRELFGKPTLISVVPDTQHLGLLNSNQEVQPTDGPIPRRQLLNGVDEHD